MKFKQVSSLMQMGRAMAQAGPPPESVATAVAAGQRWEGTLQAVGSIAPAQGVTVANRRQAAWSAIRFDSGALVKRGQALVELDTAVERAGYSVAARQDLAGVERAALAGASTSRRASSPARSSTATRSTYKAATAEVAALPRPRSSARPCAPFAGRLGIRLVNVGQMLNPGMRSCRCSRSTRSSSIFSCRSSSSRRSRRACPCGWRPMRCPARWLTARSPPSIPRSTPPRATSGSRRRSPIPRSASAPACSSTWPWSCPAKTKVL
ncbi:MAG: hypothetical protein MZU95_03335 [Desulfomicrobium escambiense]|nr:hypothetical protein [Desulfomicrobium escambiense]